MRFLFWYKGEKSVCHLEKRIYLQVPLNSQLNVMKWKIWCGEPGFNKNGCVHRMKELTLTEKHSIIIILLFYHHSKLMLSPLCSLTYQRSVTCANRSDHFLLSQYCGQFCELLENRSINRIIFEHFLPIPFFIRYFHLCTHLCAEEWEIPGGER